MGNQHFIKFSFFTDFLKEIIAGIPGCCLEISRKLCFIEVFFMKRNIVSFTIRFYDLLIPKRCIPFVIIHMGCFDVSTASSGHIEKGHGIRPS